MTDAFEAVIAAVFIDCGYRLEPVFEILERMYEDILPHIRVDWPADPLSRLKEVEAELQCAKIEVTMIPRTPDTLAVGAVALHGHELGHAQHASQCVARQLAAKRALERLTEMDLASKASLCSCVREEPVVAAGSGKRRR